ncbi:MAG: hypothetical protein LBI48_01955 [Burkholderiaceae bacterium]|jgi:hypothetical protein|nr:hypothetical protein [Burkholderiaceae bacterium]
MTDKSKFSSKKFRSELVNIMPGYAWTVHKQISKSKLEATGIQVSGFNRMSTLSISRVESEIASTCYTVKSAGFGRRNPWDGLASGDTLRKSLRELQSIYQRKANEHQYAVNKHLSLVKALKQGRVLACENEK